MVQGQSVLSKHSWHVERKWNFTLLMCSDWHLLNPSNLTNQCILFPVLHIWHSKHKKLEPMLKWFFTSHQWFLFILVCESHTKKTCIIILRFGQGFFSATDLKIYLTFCVLAGSFITFNTLTLLHQAAATTQHGLNAIVYFFFGSRDKNLAPAHFSISWWCHGLVTRVSFCSYFLLLSETDGTKCQE